MTVLENLMVVPPSQPGEHIFNNWFSSGRVRAREVAVREKAEDALAFLSVGDAPRNASLNPAEHAAWAQLTTTVLASDVALLLY